jgi:hypothetical protein
MTTRVILNEVKDSRGIEGHEDRAIGKFSPSTPCGASLADGIKAIGGSIKRLLE